MITAKIAIKAGYSFNVVNSTVLGGIHLEPAGLNVELNNEIYPLYRGATYEDSRKIDAILDEMGEFFIDEHKVD